MLKFSRFTTFEMMKSFVKDLYDYEFPANVNEEERDEEEVILIDETPICQETLGNIEYSDEGGLDESGDESDEELILIIQTQRDRRHLWIMQSRGYILIRA